MIEWKNEVVKSMEILGWKLYLDDEKTFRFHKVDSFQQSWYQAFNKENREWILYPGTSNKYYK